MDIPEGPSLEELFRAQLERRSVQGAAERARLAQVHDFVKALPKDGLLALGHLLETLSASTEAAIYWMGRVEALIEERHNVCASCGVNHEAAELDALTREVKKEGDFDAPRVAVYTEADALKLQKYRLTVDVNGGLVCRDCGLPYASLEDRMLRAPSVCSGCELKAKFG